MECDSDYAYKEYEKIKKIERETHRNEEYVIEDKKLVEQCYEEVLLDHIK